MAKSLDDVISQMRGYGMAPPPNIDLAAAFSNYLRWRPEGSKKKNAWARLFEYRSPRTGQVYITGAFGVRGDVWSVESSNADWSPAERAAELEARQAAHKAAEAERAKDAAAAAGKAAKMWAKGRDADQTARHPYLERKHVGAFGVRVGFNDRLLVPLRDVAGTIHGIQYIAADGAKIFGTGTAKEGHFHQIGEVQANLPIAFAEGYATAATVHMATGWPVVVCFDAGNIEPVLAAWRKLYPEQRLVIAADDDRHLLLRLAERLLKYGVMVSPAELKKRVGQSTFETPDADVELKWGWKDCAHGGPPRIEGSISSSGRTELLKLENAGRAKAAAAAKRHKATVLWPSFEDPEAPGTDWNDLHLLVGLEATREAFLRAYEAPPTPEKKRANGSPQAGSKKAEPIDETPDADTGMTWFERFTLIYGTTTVWDAAHREIYRIEALKLAHGKKMDTWLSSPQRQMVPQANVVFDPTGQAQAPTHINLFDALPLTPDSGGDCTLIKRHFLHLCGGDESLLHWFLCWLAYPLQHPGAKMRTSVILHGRTEGTGKSLAMDIMRSIYGRYARSITQRQIESEFNGWQSGMLLCIAEEVLSRQDRAQLQGLIQNMITNPVVQIREVYMPVRQELNYTNFVFLSNNPIPMLLNDTDRRFTVIKVEHEQPEAYFQDLGREMAAGGVEAFYAYLLSYDIGSFNVHTRPFDNRDRVALITLGMQPDRRFIEFWRMGLAGVPFCSCLARDLYTAFKAWCRVNGERYVANSTQFGKTVADCLDRMGAPPKAAKRWVGYSEKAIEAGIGSNDMPAAGQSIVYFVQHAIERMSAAPPPDVQPAGQPGADPPDPRDPEIYNKRIQSFQIKLGDLIASARRAL